jgi:hypothetical protein
MAFVPVTNVAMAEMRMIWDGQRVENTLYFLGGGAWNTTQLGTLAFDLRGWWDTSIAPEISNTVQLSEVYITDLTTATSPTMQAPGGPAFEGGLAQPSLPNSVSLAVSFRTAGRGRSSRGRNFAIGLTEVQVSGNEVVGTAVDALIDAYEVLLGLPLPNTAQWVVVSRFTNGAPRTLGVAAPVTDVVIVDPVVDTQRRRLPGRGQ